MSDRARCDFPFRVGDLVVPTGATLMQLMVEAPDVVDRLRVERNIAGNVIAVDDRYVKVDFGFGPGEAVQVEYDPAHPYRAFDIIKRAHDPLPIDEMATLDGGQAADGGSPAELAGLAVAGAPANDAGAMMPDGMPTGPQEAPVFITITPSGFEVHSSRCVHINTAAVNQPAQFVMPSPVQFQTAQWLINRILEYKQLVLSRTLGRTATQAPDLPGDEWKYTEGADAVVPLSYPEASAYETALSIVQRIIAGAPRSAVKESGREPAPAATPNSAASVSR